MLHPILQMFKKIIQTPVWQLSKQIISTYFVYNLLAHIRALTEIINLSSQSKLWNDNNKFCNRKSYSPAPISGVNFAKFSSEVGQNFSKAKYNKSHLTRELTIEILWFLYQDAKNLNLSFLCPIFNFHDFHNFYTDCESWIYWKLSAKVRGPIILHLRKQQKYNVSEETKAVLVDDSGYNVLVDFLLFT